MGNYLPTHYLLGSQIVQAILGVKDNIGVESLFALLT
jgi:hypothetical protein